MHEFHAYMYFRIQKLKLYLCYEKMIKVKCDVMTILTDGMSMKNRFAFLRLMYFNLDVSRKATLTMLQINFLNENIPRPC